MSKNPWRISRLVARSRMVRTTYATEYPYRTIGEVKRSWLANSPATTAASTMENRRLAITATPKHDCAAVSRTSSTWRWSSCITDVPGGSRVGQREHPDEERPLVHLGRDEGPDACPRVSPQREEDRDDELRRFGRERGDPLDEDELLHAV